MSITDSIYWPRVRGLDSCHAFNLTKSWFKRDVLFDLCVRECPEVDSHDIVKVIDSIEDLVREELFNFAEDFEGSSLENQAYVEGLLTALKFLGGNKSEE